LTGLPNRLQFLDRLEQAILDTRNNPSTHCAVIFLDLDRFKLVNDSLGHLTGDALLVAITRRLQLAVRSSDVLGRMAGGQTVARFGGDEFAILLRGLQLPTTVVTVAERILAELSTPFQLGEVEVYASASLGIALSGTGYEANISNQAAAMLRDADTAMYRAKAGGKNRFEVFDICMRAETVARLRLETELRRTIERGGFSMLYQPILSLETNRIEGVEALIRWQDSDGVPVSPSIFIALAEETNMVVDIGKWVLAEACREMAVWNQRLPGRELSLHVNVSCKEFLQHGFVEQVSSTLVSTGLDPRLLKLEITESGIMDNAELTSETLLELKRRNIGLSIDDFGTGYSSLSYLSRFPIDSLKIDRSFVAKLGNTAEDSHIVKAIIELAHALHLQVIAEGIETEQQLQLIRGLGCEFAQGFFIARPLTPGAFEQLMLGGLGDWERSTDPCINVKHVINY
jgi:diguanylate cyclase (GGDEF)-like protein